MASIFLQQGGERGREEDEQCSGAPVHAPLAHRRPLRDGSSAAAPPSLPQRQRRHTHPPPTCHLPPPLPSSADSAFLPYPWQLGSPLPARPPSTGGRSSAPLLSAHRDERRRWRLLRRSRRRSLRPPPCLPRHWSPLPPPLCLRCLHLRFPAATERRPCPPSLSSSPPAAALPSPPALRRVSGWWRSVASDLQRRQPWLTAVLFAAVAVVALLVLLPDVREELLRRLWARKAAVERSTSPLPSLPSSPASAVPSSMASTVPALLAVASTASMEAEAPLWGGVGAEDSRGSPLPFGPTGRPQGRQGRRGSGLRPFAPSLHPGGLRRRPRSDRRQQRKGQGAGQGQGRPPALRALRQGEGEGEGGREVEGPRGRRRRGRRLRPSAALPAGQGGAAPEGAGGLRGPRQRRGRRPSLSTLPLPHPLPPLPRLPVPALPPPPPVLLLRPLAGLLRRGSPLPLSVDGRAGDLRVLPPLRVDAVVDRVLHHLGAAAAAASSVIFAGRRGGRRLSPSAAGIVGRQGCGGRVVSVHAGARLRAGQIRQVRLTPRALVPGAARQRTGLGCRGESPRARRAAPSTSARASR